FLDSQESERGVEQSTCLVVERDTVEERLRDAASDRSLRRDTFSSLQRPHRPLASSALWPSPNRTHASVRYLELSEELRHVRSERLRLPAATPSVLHVIDSAVAYCCAGLLGFCTGEAQESR